MPLSTAIWLCRMGLERLIRKLLRLKAKPALLYYHFWPANLPRYMHFYDMGIEDRCAILHTPVSVASKANFNTYAPIGWDTAGLGPV